MPRCGVVSADLLERLRRHAAVLRNTFDETDEGEMPVIQYLWRYEDPERGDVAMKWYHDYETPEEPTAYEAGIDLAVGADCLFVHIPLNEGQFMDDVAEAIAEGGALMREAANEIERLRALIAAREVTP